MKVGLVVPVYVNFPGFAELVRSVDIPVTPHIIDNWNDNRGVSKGWNIGIEESIKSGDEVTFIVNDDVVFSPGTMDKMIEGLSQFDLTTGINIRDEFDPTDSPDWIPHPDFSCFAIKPAEFVDKFGWFDEEFTPAYFEDNDMFRRIELAGGTAMRNIHAPFYHKGSVTQNWGGSQVVTSPMFDMNRMYYIEKWGGQPGEEIFTTPFNEGV